MNQRNHNVSLMACSRWLLFQILAIAVVLSACSSPEPRQEVTQIDWVNFVKIGGIRYLENTFVEPDVLDAADLGSVYATVAFRTAGVVHDPAYRAKDGDAAYLPVGTSLYIVNGYAPETRLAARLPQGIVLYDADSHPKAGSGAELLDLAGKVAAIGINSEQDGTTELARIEDPATIDTLVSLVLEAPVDQISQSNSGERVFIAFHLSDGTQVARAYWLETGELSRGILLPPDFRTAVELALSSAGSRP